ncbi:acyltransferase family protein [Acinetobacter sichuanensis]|uniref:Acyltransferase n=1 Tax=Acinetobacter sichuanensis TaxID=2136183 RepID=A0A371YIW2_9GAMM|nr:acyltransferase family protein [Acinetobacter sichuanensis]RFC81429.1 acyltransferase [Acinetobacter sichuanensis]
MTYRGEIEGLRAIAVLLVLFNHLQIQIFKGGYIGVDIFFVISGFLITMMIKKEIENSEFKIANFYKKRVIRIAPAYFFVLLITSISAFFLLTSYDLISYFKSALASSFFVSNFYFWKTAGGYFSENSQELFLLHFWSLSVEEQFYLTWPLLLFIFFKFSKNFKRTTYVIALAIIFGAIFSEFVALRYNSISYFSPITRSFELLIGALLVFTPNIKINRITAEILYLISVLILIYCTLTFNEKTIFPGYAALFPCLATATIIYINNKESLIFKILSIKPMRFIGKISYPMYLWHWPIIVIFNILMIEINFYIGLFITLLTILLSYLTYILLEKPIQIKSKNLNNIKVFTYGYFIPTLFLFCCTLSIIFLKGMPQRFNESINNSSYALTTYPSRIRNMCHSSKEGFDPANCILGNNKEESSFIIVGDSIANHFTPMIDIFAKDANIKGHDYTKDRTAFLPHTKLFNENGIEDKAFIARNNEIIKIIESGKYKKIILSGGYYSIFNNEKLYSSTQPIENLNSVEAGLTYAVELITKSGATPIIIYPTPRLENINNKCAVKKQLYNLNISCEISIKQLHEQSQKFNTFMLSLKRLYPTIEVIDTTKASCDKKLCYSSINSIPLYLDKSHLNHIGSKLLAEKYLSMFKNPLL